MTPNKEDYLKCIYELGQHHEKIVNKDIATLMQVSAPAVSEMTKKLMADQLIIKTKENGYQLTSKGQELVAKLYRKHRLIEVFLVEHLHYTSDLVHTEAEILEHAMSDFLIDRLEEHLDFPKRCPHGGTIPQKGQLLQEDFPHSLAQINQTGLFELKRIPDDLPLLVYLDDNNFHLSQVFTVEHIDEFAQTYTISYDNKQLTIPKTIAEHLYVHSLSNYELLS